MIDKLSKCERKMANRVLVISSLSGCLLCMCDLAPARPSPRLSVSFFGLPFVLWPALSVCLLFLPAFVSSDLFLIYFPKIIPYLTLSSHVNTETFRTSHCGISADIYLIDYLSILLFMTTWPLTFTKQTPSFYSKFE